MIRAQVFETGICERGPYAFAIVTDPILPDMVKFALLLKALNER